MATFVVLIASTILVNAQVNRVMVNGVPIWLNGINLPWVNWTDFETPWGGNNYNSGQFEAAFQRYAANGINSVRVWIHCAGEGGPLLDSQGNVTGVVGVFWENFDDMMRLANRYNILVMPSLFSFDIARTNKVLTNYPNQTSENFRAFVYDPVKTQTYIDRVLIPLVQRYENDPMLLAWEICNEPEWMFENLGFNRNAVVRWHAQIAAAINRNTSKPVVNGAASLKWNWDNPHGTEVNLWSDASLQAQWNDSLAYFDWYQIHFYDWMIPWYNPFVRGPNHWGIGYRPVIIGESPGDTVNFGGFNMTVTQMYEAAFNLGYAGVMAWSDLANDGHGDFAGISVATNHMKNRFPQYIFTPPGSTAIAEEISGEEVTARILNISPNPFYQVAKITMIVPSTVAAATLQIIDQYGRIIETKEISGTGVQTHTFYGINLPPGIYFAVLRAENQIQTQKMVLLK